MNIRLQKWGNSQGIRIPNSLIKSLQLQTNDLLDIVQDKDKLIITKKSEFLTFKQRIKECGNSDTTDLPNYFDYGEPVGKEIW